MRRRDKQYVCISIVGCEHVHEAKSVCPHFFRLTTSITSIQNFVLASLLSGLRPSSPSLQRLRVISFPGIIADFLEGAKVVGSSRDWPHSIYRKSTNNSNNNNADENENRKLHKLIIWQATSEFTHGRSQKRSTFRHSSWRKNAERLQTLESIRRKPKVFRTKRINQWQQSRTHCRKDYLCLVIIFIPFQLSDIYCFILFVFHITRSLSAIE